jgi:hypothetical protein
MTYGNHVLIEPMAYYAAAQATADWLTGESPRGIYRWDDHPTAHAQTMSTRRKSLVKLGTNFRPVMISDKPTRSEVKLARASVLNKAFVALAGIGGLQMINRFRKEATPSLFHLVVGDLEQASKLLRPVSRSDDLTTFLAFQILEVTLRYFQERRIQSVVREIAEFVQETGSLEHEGGFLEDFFHELRGVRTTFPQTILPWPSTSGKYVVVDRPPERVTIDGAGASGGLL